jgi:MFS family permease
MSSTPATTPPRITLPQWLIIIIAIIGFLFDTYQLLMTPLAGPSAISELLKVPMNNPAVSEWMGNLLWLSALSGGVFGLLGGWLTDRLGRKFVMALGIFVYSFSPVGGAYCHSLGAFIFFRCATFVGVCIEFVAAVTWIAEVFTDKVQKERWLGVTQAFASLGGVMVSGISIWIGLHSKSLPHIGLPSALGAADPAAWRYLMLTGLIPAIPIALLLPFVPESRIWREKKQAGALKRPSLGELFSPEFLRVTLITAGLSACAYGVAFGALQLTPRLIAPGLPNLAQQRKALLPLVAEAKVLTAKFDATQPNTPERKAALGPIKVNAAKQKPILDQVKHVGSETQLYQELGGLAGRIVLALLIIVGIGRRLLLRLLQIPGLIIVPVTYFLLYKQDATVFSWGIALIGFVVMSQLSFLGEYLPRAFPMHLRGTGGSFATNVGGRMLGTSAAFITPKLVTLFAGSPYDKMAHAAGWMGFIIVAVSIVLGFFLQEPKADAEV